MSTPGPLDPLSAANPEHNATVHASAGTGKTWLLVTRIIRLLLAGATPDSVLAVTFTRKAAAEMQQRLSERLRGLMCADDVRLDELLGQCGLEADAELRRQARRLYEQHLFHPYPMRTTTFHAFCQDLLHRFPLETGIPPGFEISETTALLELAAWDALFAEATLQPELRVAQALEELLERCNGLSNTRHALLSFLSHRSDWWAFTDEQSNATGFAQQRLRELLGITATEDPLAGFPDQGESARLQEFARLLERNGTPTDRKFQRELEAVLAEERTPQEHFARSKPVFLTATDQPRARKATAALDKRLGAAGAVRYLELHAQCVAGLLERLDRMARWNTLQLCSAWYRAGARLLTHYQRIKQEQRLLDFADLEWQACRLLNRSDHAHWVQYKLDRRIDHLLVDEFQDTNPTQWHLLLPLLEELAASASDAERSRSVFLVGDEKQSIYRFRRANPALLGMASAWLADRLQAGKYPLDKSRRSARAIIECVNCVFGAGPLNERIHHYETHETYHQDLYGRVEVLPLQTQAPATGSPAAGLRLRNPLVQPRLLADDLRYYREGQVIAERIRTLVGNGTLIGTAGAARQIGYGDIMILLRQRTHASAYEYALRDAGIPFLGADRGTLLENLEIRDLEALLNVLVSPYDNLALAQVLRSPLFGVADEDLMRLAARPKGTWYARLAATGSAESPALATAYRMLSDWRALAGQIPVHDLLDRIYFQAELLSRYESAFPPALRPRVRANLIRFIELALEVDSGRYPSLPRFLAQLQRLRRLDQDQPDAGAPEEVDGSRLRLLTIHAAKGLESPVVFLADAAVAHRKPQAYAALVDWPAGADRPVHFLLGANKAGQDRITASVQNRQEQDELREDANLLYVALTRARQFLFISGSAAADHPGTSWYAMIHSALTAGGYAHEGASPVIETGVPPATASDRPVRVRDVTPDPRLGQRLELAPGSLQIAPSRTASMAGDSGGDPDGRTRGIAIHLMLERLSQGPVAAPRQLPAGIAAMLHRDPADPELLGWWREALAVYTDPALAKLYDRSGFIKAWNEVPVQYLAGDRLIHGIMDRLVLGRDAVQVIDYKTHRMATPDTVQQLAAHYRDQLAHYARGAALLWPDCRIESFLLFTACNRLVKME
jgi:ATP-dependent helicase/nuclease subunit A